jgi:hypothetical protein
MDIKRTQPGPPNWSRADQPRTDPKAGAPSPDAPLGAAAGSPAFDAIRGEFKRVDLSTPRWNALLARSIDALLDSTAQRMGGLPDSAREKISGLLAADPIFSKRVFVYWDKNLN